MIEWWGARNGRLLARSPSRSARHAVDPRHLDRLRAAQRRQDRGEPLGEHRLARARRPAQQAVVGARGRHDQRSHRVVLAAHIAQVRSRGIAESSGLGCAVLGQRIGRAAAEDAHGAAQTLDGGYLQTLDQHASRARSGASTSVRRPAFSVACATASVPCWQACTAPSSASSPNSTWLSSGSLGAACWPPAPRRRAPGRGPGRSSARRRGRGWR